MDGMFKTITIRVRLIISSAAFLVPLGMLLFSSIADYNDSIRTARLEQRGLDCLRSVAGLFRLGFEQARGFTQDREPESAGTRPGQKAAMKGEIDAFLSELEEAYGNLRDSPSPGRAGPEGTGEDQGAGELITQLRGAFAILPDTGGEAELAIYAELARDLRALAALTGRSFSLISEQDAAGYYLVQAGVRSIPRFLERIFLTGNLLRLAQIRGALSGDNRSSAAEYLSILGNADYPLILSDMEAALACLAEDGPLPGGDTAGMYPLLASYRSAVEGFIFSTRSALSLLPGEAPGQASPESGVLLGSYADARREEALAVEQSYRLMSSSLNQLETLLQRRVRDCGVQLTRFLAAAVLVSALFFAVIFMINITIAGSIKQFMGLLRALENNDLSVRAPAESGDELGKLAAAFNGFLENLSAALMSCNRDISMVSSAVFDLSSSAREISTTANEQSASVAEILSTMEGNKELSAQGAAKTQEVAGLAAKTQELSRRGADLRDANQEMMSRIRDQNGKIIDEINGLADMLVRINESIAIIDSIADQTKLIAFNASLEAAASVNYGEGSGEESARFSVVAAEIRRFADNVVDSTGEIKEQIREVQQASRALIEEANGGRLRIDQGYERMVQQKEVFEEIVAVSRNVADRSRQISDLSKQQEYASAQIFIALKEISAGVNQFVSATASTSRTADNLNTMSVELKDVLKAYRIVPPEGQEAVQTK
jgi:methyl-accepting chemotaxis protein